MISFFIYEHVLIFLILLSFICKMVMFRGLDYHPVAMSLRLKLACYSTCFDMSLVFGAFGVCALGVILADSKPFIQIVVLVLFSAFLFIHVFFTIVDTAIFLQSNNRIDLITLRNTTPVSIRGMLSEKEIAAMALVLSGSALFVFVIAQAMFLYITIQQLYIPLFSCLVSVFLFCFSYKTTMTQDEAMPFVDQQNGWIKERLALFLSENINIIIKPAFINFIFLFKNKKPYISALKHPLTPQEHSILKNIGLEADATDRKPYAFTPKRYSRIILLSIESLALKYVSKYNSRIPMQTTPFLNYISRKFHFFENYYTTTAPTDVALISILGSRLPDTWYNEETTQETIFSVLRKEHYKTYHLRNVSKYYDNHHKRIPGIYKPEILLGSEELEKEYPNCLHNEWGVCDTILYEKALALLETHRNDPLCLFIGAMDTHPPYWFSEKVFPPPIASTRSRALRSLYQMDCELAAFFGKLRERRLFDDNTLLLIFGDHSPAVGPEYKELTDDSFFPTRVPLAFLTTKPNAFQQIPADTLSCQLDFLPTLCHGMGLDIPSSAIGQSLFCNNPKFIVQDYGLKLVSTPTAQFSFDFAAKNLSAEEQAVQKWMANRMNGGSGIR